MDINKHLNTGLQGLLFKCHVVVIPVDLESRTGEQVLEFPRPVRHFDCVKRAEMKKQGC